MRRVYTAASWLCGNLALALLALGTLAVPTQLVWADSGGCEGLCGTHCSAYFTVGTPEYEQCVASCMPICENPTNCEGQCGDACAVYYEVGSPAYGICVSACVNMCQAAAANCPNSAGCSVVCFNNQNCFNLLCTNVIGCTCDNNTYNPNCSTLCRCNLIGNGCECGNKP